MAELGPALRAAREAAEISLAGLARRTNFSKSLLGLIETGRRTVHPEHVRAYARALRMPVDFFYGPPQGPLRVAHEWLVADSPVAVASRAGRRVGPSLAVELETRVVRLRHLDDTLGGGDLYPVVEKELADVQQVLNSASYTEETGRQLLTVVAELAQLAGWTASDGGRYACAQSVYLTGVSAAQEACDRVLAGQLLSSLSYQMANVGDPRDAMLLARSAVKGADFASPVVRTLLLERLAWASARTGDQDGTRRALDAVDDTFEQRSPGVAEPEWVYWLDRREIDVMAGRCLIELGEPARAEPLLSTAITGYQANHVREVGLYLSWLAEAYARAGQADAARATLDRARNAAQGVNSVRLDQRIRDVEQIAPSSVRR